MKIIDGMLSNFIRNGPSALVPANFLGSFSALLNEPKMLFVALYSYKLTIFNPVIILANDLIVMALFHDQI